MAEGQEKEYLLIGFQGSLELLGIQNTLEGFKLFKKQKDEKCRANSCHYWERETNVMHSINLVKSFIKRSY
ncbi:hypothetical protein [Neobacillus mesonae]|uniref:hypothetical protein n=1 Tax=Neobacillus mesonae TaxID=1193713 RepID=UPI0020411655|nr:hypothetical protein [Neobacillus mesonae]MCM3569259.1 hypothetical protein [Neobacillus mesonae]